MLCHNDPTPSSSNLGPPLLRPPHLNPFFYFLSFTYLYYYIAIISDILEIIHRYYTAQGDDLHTHTTSAPDGNSHSFLSFFAAAGYT